MTIKHDEQESQPNILISTLFPLGSNYGGLLQAYALQKVIQNLGYNAQTINSQRRFNSLRLLARKGRFYFNKYVKKADVAFPLSVKDARLVRKFPLEFLSSHIETVDLFGLAPQKRRRLLRNTDAIVVGSDQVWRGGYAHIPDQLANYADGLPILKISYAASFGADRLVRFSRRDLHLSRKLIQQFQAISVRESTGIQICRDIWGIQAEQHLDPTLLLSREEYEELISNKTKQTMGEEGKLFAYVLDRNPATNQIVEELSAQLKLGTLEFFMEEPSSKTDLKTKLDQYQMKPVEQWLENFSKAEFVVTDSFHGTVFSIIFNKPFISIGNSSRGLARFESLLSLLGLDSRLVNLESKNYRLDTTVPDWTKIEGILNLEKHRALKYLQDNLPK